MSLSDWISALQRGCSTHLLSCLRPPVPPTHPDIDLALCFHYFIEKQKQIKKTSSSHDHPFQPTPTSACIHCLSSTPKANTSTCTEFHSLSFFWGLGSETSHFLSGSISFSLSTGPFPLTYKDTVISSTLKKFDSMLFSNYTNILVFLHSGSPISYIHCPYFLISYFLFTPIRLLSSPFHWYCSHQIYQWPPSCPDQWSILSFREQIFQIAGTQ